MMTNPVDLAPNTTFEDAMRAEPRTTGRTTGDTFQLALSRDGIQMGWLGKNGSDWAVLAPDRKEAMAIELYPYNGVNYYRIKGTSRYLSVSGNAYVGFYNWSGATGWTRNGNNIVSNYNGQKLSLYSKENGYLYAWDAYSVLDVKFEGM